MQKKKKKKRIYAAGIYLFNVGFQQTCTKFTEIIVA